jgi:hypothetical protein
METIIISGMITGVLIAGLFVWRDIKLRSLPNETNNLESRVNELENKISQIYLRLANKKS